MAGSTGNHCSFVLLAEFHILEGAQLKYQFPQPLGVDESVLAMSMLPDGAETQLDDWTVFFLNQTPFNTISPVLALDSPELRSTSLPGEQDYSKPDLLCVLNLVRTKHDKTLNRGAQVLALAICTRHPFIQIFKPVLLMALDDYLINPSQDCLARLFDAVNSMDFTGAPILTRHEKIVMRLSERKDIFSEKFQLQQNQNGRPVSWNTTNHRSNFSMDSHNTFDETIFGRKDPESRQQAKSEHWDTASRATTDTYAASSSTSPPSDSSFTLGGSAVWVGDESELNIAHSVAGTDTGDNSSLASASGTTMVSSSRRRRSTDASSGSSHLNPKSLNAKGPSSYDAHLRSGLVKDTHFFHTTVNYKDYKLPIKMPLATFSEEVGDYSLITLVKIFSSHQLVFGPQHPHLHTSGPQTHPIIILFNALVTGKRIIFLGHRRPAGEVSTFVLAACALASGCGAVLRGFVERAFPYANLNNRDEWESVPAYIAGVTNPIFETSRMWDLLLDISSGSVTVSKDIHTAHPVTATGFIAPLISRSGTLKAESSTGTEEELRMKDANKGDSKTDNPTDNLFIEDIKSAIEYHYGEGLVRVRFTEYVTRFVRLASRYEEEVTNTTNIGWPNRSFVEGSSTRQPQLGSGVVFNDEYAGGKELAANAHRIEAWRKTNSYQYFAADFVKFQTANNPIRGFDVMHQIFRLRHVKGMSESETYMIMRTLADNVRSYDQVVELLSYLMPHSGGLLPLGFGLFHPKESIREATVDLFNHLRQYPVGVLFLQSLNHFQRYAYVRQAHAREKQHQLQQSPPQQQYAPPPIASRTHSNSSGALSVSNSYFGERANGAF